MTPTDAINTLAVLALPLITLGYISTCLIWPFKACRSCRGTGKLHSPITRAIRLCPRCKSTGLRLRAGRKAWNAYRRLHRSNQRNR